MPEHAQDRNGAQGEEPAEEQRRARPEGPDQAEAIQEHLNLPPQLPHFPAQILDGPQ